MALLLRAAVVLGLLCSVAAPASLTPPASPAGANATTKAIVYDPTFPDGLRVDRAALLALRSAIYANGYGRSLVKAGWSRSPSANPCFPGWPHITCWAYRVTAIDLAGMGIRAANLPPELADMDQLRTLDLSGNEITGTLPDVYGRRLSFVRLQTLNLQDNALYGTLPRWNAKGAWAKLSTLNLQGNSFTGGLPTTWAGSFKPLRKLVTLDLSFNYLGLDGSRLPNEWGSAARSNPFAALQTLRLFNNYFGGTLPDWGKSNAFPSLRLLDLRYNQLTGALPAAWGSQGAFPRLRELQLSGNDLGDSTAPGGLPISWTRVTVPRAFPALTTMLLYPGNENTCAWLSGNTQSAATYKVYDDSGVEYNTAGTPWLCPDPGIDNPPSAASAEQAGAGATVTMRWTGPGGATAGFMCGFRTAITTADAAATVVYTADWTVRPAASGALSINTGTTPATYSASTGAWAPTAGVDYRLFVYTLNCNKYTFSSAPFVTFTGA